MTDEPRGRITLQVIEFDGVNRLVAHAKHASGNTGAHTPIDSREDLDRLAARCGCAIEEVVFGEGTHSLFDALPERQSPPAT